MQMRYFYVFLAGLFGTAALHAQTPRILEAFFLPDTPTLDGVLDDACWQALAPLEAFVSSTPVFGMAPKARTEARIFYGPTALYIGAHCRDAAGVRADNGIRDGQATGDWFRISLDTWNDDRLAFDFTVTAAGVQLDARNGIGSWDAPWQSAVARQVDGWSVEICIPYTVLRFARKAVQDWGLQCTRFDRTTGETSTWSPQDPLIRDRVLQFGTLTGLHDVQQVRRRSMATQTEAALHDQRNLEPYSYSINYGLDGRIGLGPAATLDLTILPQRKYISVPLSVFIRGQDFWVGDDGPSPRQFLEEERDLFEQNLNVNYGPTFSPTDFLWRVELGSGSFFAPYSPGTQGKILQATKLTARTQGRWRFGTYNALLGPVRTGILGPGLPPMPMEFTETTLQRLSNYNIAAAEYLLPNNGFVNISTGTLLAGQGHTTATPALRFQVRDRSNRYEVRGGTDWQYALRNSAESLGYNYYFGIARINRRWGWALNHQEINRTVQAPDGAAPTPTAAYTSAEVQYRDFRPTNRWQNRFGSLGLRTERVENSTPIRRPLWQLYGNLAVLDKQFRSWALNWSATPAGQTLPYSNVFIGAYINRKLATGINGSAEFTSDNRKHLIWGARVGGATTLKNELPTLAAATYLTWVPEPQWTLQGGLYAQQLYERLYLLPIPGRWLFERHNEGGLQADATIAWHPGTRWRVWGSLLAEHYNRTNREAVELEDNGRLTVVEWDLDPFDQDSRNYVRYAVGFQCFFSSISQLRFQYGHNRSAIGTFPPGGFIFNRYVGRGETTLTLIWFLDGISNRR